MTSVGTRLTAEQFAQLPDELDGSRMELVDGEVIVAPPPSFEHGRITSRVVHAISLQNTSTHVTVVENAGFVLRRNPDLVRAPDVALVKDADSRLRSPSGYLEGAPALAVEVVSPSDSAARLDEKVRDYLAAGAQRVWVVWPDTRSVTVHRPDGTALTRAGDDALNEADLGLPLSGFAIKLADIFPSPRN